MQRPSGSAANFTALVGSREEPEIEEAFDRLVAEGGERLSRLLLPLLATGFLGGIDVGVGVLAYLVVKHESGSSLLGALAFTIGFVALLMAAASCSPRTSWCRSPQSSPAGVRSASWLGCGA